MTDLELTPDRAERIRAMVEVELQRLLERQGIPDGLTGGAISYISEPMMHLTDLDSDSRLAGGLAQSIGQALRSVG